MLPLDAVTGIIESHLQAGIDDRKIIVRAVAAEIEPDIEELRLLAADRRVSLGLASMRDDDGVRLAFPSRNDEGERVIVHVHYSHDAKAMYRAGIRIERIGKSMVEAGQLLQERAVQLGLFDHVGANA